MHPHSIISLVGLALVCLATSASPAPPPFLGGEVPSISISLAGAAASATNIDINIPYPAQVIVNGRLCKEPAQLKFLAAALGQSSRRNFELSTEPNTELSKILGTTNLLFDGADTQLLRSYTVSLLGSLMNVPVARNGHAVVSLLNLRPHLYSVVDRCLQNVLTNPGSVVLPSLGRDLPQIAAAEHGTAADVLADAVKALLSPEVGSRIDQAADALDLAAFYRFIAFESLCGDYLGYAYLGQSEAVAVDEALQQMQFVAGVHVTSLSSEYGPFFTRGRGFAARSLTETKEGREGMFLALQFAVTNAVTEADLKSKLQERAALLEKFAVGPVELNRLRNSSERLNHRITARFAEVKNRLLACGGSLKYETLPVSSVSMGSGGKLPAVRNPVDYGGRFTALLSTNTMLTSSIPFRVYPLTLMTAPGTLEALTWKSTNWVSVGVKSGTTVLSNVALRLKGHGTRAGFDHKPSFTLKFNAETPGQMFFNQSKIHVQSARFDPTYMNQFIASWVFQKAGLPVARIDFCDLTVNGTPYGLCVVSEGITKTFLKREFGTDRGLLWEGESRDLNGTLDLDNGKLEDMLRTPQQLFIAAQKALQMKSLENFSEYVDARQLAKFCAVEVFIGHRDGYALSHSNYRVYQPEPKSAFTFIPHGMDALDFDMDDGLQPPPLGLAAQVMMQIPEGRTMYQAAMSELVLQDVELEHLAQDLAAVTRQIAPVLNKFDPLLAREQAAAASAALRSLGNRSALIRQELDTHKNFAHFGK